MGPFDRSCLDRREFLKRAALAGSISIAGSARSATARAVSIISSSDDEVASESSVQWAVEEVKQSLDTHSVLVRFYPRADLAPVGDLCIVVAGAETEEAWKILKGANASVPAGRESLALVPAKRGARSLLLASGADARGLVYALLEIADRVNYGRDPFKALDIRKAVVEQPANAIRSADRCFVSDVEDKPWYYDRAMWPSYLTMLTTQRFNRFTLSFGIGYDYPHPIKDAYFYFAYPFLVEVPGYDVRASGLSSEERDRNLNTLRLISDEAASRGLDFQLGLWTHAYQWPKGSDANYTIEGLTPETHAPYCRDALATLLRACPAINGLALRVHGESGIPEGNFSFWQTLFHALTKSGRRIEINMHAKGMSQRMIDIALATGMPVTISPKYWAEHRGLPYQPSSIRQMEMPPRGPAKKGFFELSSGARRFLRYSYGDLLKRDRRYGVIFRIWPGTQRCLLWGDPAMAAGDAQAGGFCGSLGFDLLEPLSFKGRHGSGLPGGRCAYADALLNPRYDWEKFLYSYRVWGRHLYNPNADPDAWRRLLRRQFGAAAPATETALGNASRILRLVTTARGPSAANNSYWPEIYTNMPMVDAGKNHLYRDTLNPKIFDNVSSFDPEIFSQINDFAEQMLNGMRSGKYSPLEVAQWLEDFADVAMENLTEANARTANVRAPEFRRLAVDVSIQAAIGRFFAWKLRSGVLYALYERAGDRSAIEQAVIAYRRARAHWADAANHAKGVYMSDITYGIETNLRGTWSDRLPTIDNDLKDLEDHISQAKRTVSGEAGGEEKVAEAIREVLRRPARPSIPCRHISSAHFHPGRPLPIALSIEKTDAGLHPSLIGLTYRHVNQGEYYEVTEMRPDRHGSRYQAVIPGNYTASPYDLQYFFELHAGPGKAWLYPGLGPDLSRQPYFHVFQARGS